MSESWHCWWDYNKDRFLKRQARLAEEQSVQSDSTDFFFGRQSGRLAIDADRPGRACVREHVLPALVAALRDDALAVRYRAAVAIGKTGAPEGLPRLLEALADRDELVREGAAMGLALLQHPEARTALLALLDDGQPARRLLGGRRSTDELRGIAAVGLGLLAHAHPGIDADGALRDALVRQSLDRSHDHHIPMACVAALGLFRERAEVRRAIAGHLRRVAAPGGPAAEWVRAQAVLAVGRLAESSRDAADSTDVAFLVDVLETSRNAALGRSAALALATAGIGPDGPQPAAVQALGRKLTAGRDRLTRGFSAISLGHLGGAQAHAMLTLALFREKQELQVYCGLGLAIACGARSARAEADPERLCSGRERLRAAFERTRSPDARGGFAIALGIAGDADAGPMLLAAYRSARSVRFRGDCAVALGMIGHSAAAGALLDTIRAKYAAPELREHTALGLGLLRARATVPPLVAALASEPSHAARIAFTQALGLVGDRTAIAPLAGLLDSSRHSAHTRAYACWALGSLGDPRPLGALAPLRANHNYHACCGNFNAMLVLVDP
ncbi:MAG: HEAT repeat domain-containing protein [Planctomycetes bacterium]|nr:HEAT repeat domain-containing protein [Planctomycetota bacterium]